MRRPLDEAAHEGVPTQVAGRPRIVLDGRGDVRGAQQCQAGRKVGGQPQRLRFVVGVKGAGDRVDCGSDRRLCGGQRPRDGEAGSGDNGDDVRFIDEDVRAGALPGRSSGVMLQPVVQFGVAAAEPIESVVTERLDPKGQPAST